MRRLCTGLLVGLLATTTLLAAERPNVLLFLVDDMGWMDSSTYGSRYYESPHLDRLAAQGMRFTDAYALPLCSPTRASILTGKYSSRHGVTSATGHQPPQPEDDPLLPETAPPRQRWIYPESRNYLLPEEFTLAEALQQAGYRTGHLGKWHLGLTEPHWPDRQGFEVTFHGKPDPGPASYFSPYGFRLYQSFPDGPDGEYITDRLTAEAIRFIDVADDRPFFLNLWHYGVHGPWGHREEITRRYADKNDPREEQGNPIMASMLHSVDESLGRILDHLERSGQARETVVIFYSDNGGNTHSNTPDDQKQARVKPGHPRYEMLADWRKWAGDRPPTSNAPLRDGKGRLYEGGIRVPLVVSWPGRIAAGTLSDAIVGPIDLYPTIFDLLGLPLPEQQHLDGLSFAPVLTGRGDFPRETYFTWFPHLVPGVAVRQREWKLIRRYEPTPEYPSGFELFNLKEDLSEQHNLAGDRPEKVAELNALIDSFLKQTHARQPVPNPAFDTKARSQEAALRGWVVKFAESRSTPDGLQLDAQSQRILLARTGLKQTGPLLLRLRLTAPRGGAGEVQWRLAGQETFQPGLSAPLVVEPREREQLVELPLPIEGELFHLRMFLPGSSRVVVSSIEFWDAAGTRKLQEWSFASSN